MPPGKPPDPRDFEEITWKYGRIIASAPNIMGLNREESLGACLDFLNKVIQWFGKHFSREGIDLHDLGAELNRCRNSLIDVQKTGKFSSLSSSPFSDVTKGNLYKKSFLDNDWDQAYNLIIKVETLVRTLIQKGTSES